MEHAHVYPCHNTFVASVLNPAGSLAPYTADVRPATFQQ